MADKIGLSATSLSVIQDKELLHEYADTAVMFAYDLPQVNREQLAPISKLVFMNIHENIADLRLSCISSGVNIQVHT